MIASEADETAVVEALSLRHVQCVRGGGIRPSL